jgi:photosystem II stability/assembly factor-like uncharacterized protein
MPGHGTPAAAAAARPRGCAYLLLVALVLAQSARGAEAPAPPSAVPARLAARALLIGIAAAGERLVAVGDRGIIVLSDDKGVSWAQAAQVPTQALLTGVCFFDAQHGLAVGHDEVALVTADAGRSWRLAHYAPEAQRPLLDVWCGSGGHAIAIGAYSTYLTSADGGASWTEGKFVAAPRKAAGGAKAAAAAGPAAGDEGAGGGYHLNRIAPAGGGRLYIAGETGHLYRSDDSGGSWQELATPYAGSFFGALPLGGEGVLAFGLRGNLYRSEDAGLSWQKIDTGTVALLDGGARFDDEGVAIVGLSGVVLVSHDGGHSFALRQQSDYAALAAALTLTGEAIAVVGENGTRVINLRDTPPAAAVAH